MISRGRDAAEAAEPSAKDKGLHKERVFIREQMQRPQKYCDHLVTNLRNMGMCTAVPLVPCMPRHINTAAINHYTPTSFIQQHPPTTECSVLATLASCPNCSRRHQVIGLAAPCTAVQRCADPTRTCGLAKLPSNAQSCRSCRHTTPPASLPAETGLAQADECGRGLLIAVGESVSWAA